MIHLDPLFTHYTLRLEGLQKHLHDLTSKFYEIEKYENDSYKQYESVDCAIFLMEAVKSLAFDMEMDFINQERMAQFRKCAFVELCRRVLILWK